MQTRSGVVLSRAGAGLTALLAVLYVGVILAQGNAWPNETGQVVAWTSSLVVATVASGAASVARRRATAVALLSVTLVLLLAWTVLAIFSVGILFLVPAAVITVALVQTARPDPSTSPTSPRSA